MQETQSKAPGPIAELLFFYMARPFTLLLLLAVLALSLFPMGESFWLLYGFCSFVAILIEAIRRPVMRKVFGQRIALLFLLSGLVVVVQQHYLHAARQEAEMVLARVQQYRQRHSNFPTNLRELGFGSEEKRSTSDHLVFYSLNSDGPQLSYRDPRSIGVRWQYDFKSGAWVELPYD